jgi:hypothetical protein
VLVNNGNGDLLNVSAPGGGFTISQNVVSGANYDVQVRTQPTGQDCLVQNGSGAVTTSNVTNVVVTCTLNSYSLGGTISGLNLGGLTPQTNLVLANGSDTITVPFGANSFSFHNPVPYLNSYNVVVQTQPSLLNLLGVVIPFTCTVPNPSGTMVVGGVSNVDVSCSLL